MNIYQETHNNLPSFMIIGAQKAGTTALYEYLSRHPQIQSTKEKELHFFDRDDRYRLGVEYYRAFFEFENNSRLSFDASAGYLACTKSPSRIFAYNRNVKLIVLLRDPVTRAYSAWNMYKQLYSTNRNWFFDDWTSTGEAGKNIIFLRRQDHRLSNFLHYVLDEIEFNATYNASVVLEAPIISHGHYFTQIQRYLALFDRAQLLFLENTELRYQTVECLQKIEAFLGITACNWGKINLQPVFAGSYVESLDKNTWQILADYYATVNEQLFELLGKRYGWGYRHIEELEMSAA